MHKRFQFDVRPTESLFEERPFVYVMRFGLSCGIEWLIVYYQKAQCHHQDKCGHGDT